MLTGIVCSPNSYKVASNDHQLLNLDWSSRDEDYSLIYTQLDMIVSNSALPLFISGLERLANSKWWRHQRLHAKGLHSWGSLQGWTGLQKKSKVMGWSIFVHSVVNVSTLHSLPNAPWIAWHNARAHMESTYAPQQIAIIGFVTSVSDILGHLDQLQDQQKARKSFRLLGKIQLRLNGLQTYDEALKISSGGNSMVARMWGSLKFCSRCQFHGFRFHYFTLSRVSSTCVDDIRW